MTGGFAPLDPLGVHAAAAAHMGAILAVGLMAAIFVPITVLALWDEIRRRLRGDPEEEGGAWA